MVACIPVPTPRMTRPPISIPTPVAKVLTSAPIMQKTEPTNSATRLPNRSARYSRMPHRVRGSLLDHVRQGAHGHKGIRLTEVERCADQPKSMSHGTVEVLLPSRYSLETVEKGSIILKMSEALDGG